VAPALIVSSMQGRSEEDAGGRAGFAIIPVIALNAQRPIPSSCGDAFAPHRPTRRMPPYLLAGSIALVATTVLSAARPLVGAPVAAPLVCDAVWRDAARDRDVPVRIRLPDGTGTVPVVLFSHGLGGNLDAGTSWGEHWAANGLAVIHLQHAGSDDALWRGKPMRGRQAALRRAMSGEQLVARVEDVKFVLTALDSRSSEGRCDLRRIDRARVGMSGHSYGAHTTQAVAGQRFAGGRAMPDPRVRAAIAFSPAPPARADERALAQAFGAITMPFMSLTGTRDEVPGLTDITPAQRTLPYRHMPSGAKYLLVFDGADHAAFGGQPRLARARGNATPDAIVEDVQAATLAFWRATLLDDAAARAWLTGGALRASLAAGDRFEHK
jgi:predicted dienelactone hydrolase